MYLENWLRTAYNNHIVVELCVLVRNKANHAEQERIPGMLCQGKRCKHFGSRNCKKLGFHANNNICPCFTPVARPWVHVCRYSWISYAQTYFNQKYFRMYNISNLKMSVKVRLYKCSYRRRFEGADLAYDKTKKE